MLRRNDPIKEAAERLRKTVRKDRGRQGIQPATVVGTRGKNDRDVIECELDTGEIVNAVAHGQGEFGVGQVVYLERLHGRKGRHWLVVTSASPPDGRDNPPPPKAIQLHKGKPKGVRRLPGSLRVQGLADGRIAVDPNRTTWMVAGELASGDIVQAVYTGEPHAIYGEIEAGDTILVKEWTRNRWFQWRVPETAEEGRVEMTVTENPVEVSYELALFEDATVLMKDMQAVLQLANTNATYVQARVSMTKKMQVDEFEWWILAFEDSDGDGEFGDEFTGKPNWGFPVNQPFVNENGEEGSERILEGYGDLTEPEAVSLITKDYFVFVLALVRVKTGHVSRRELPLVRRASIRLLDDLQYQVETGVDPWPFQNDDEVLL